MGACDKMIQRTKNLEVPTARGDDKCVMICLGVLNCFLFGVGMIIIGAWKDDMPNLLMGVCQLFIPFVGWLWAIIWGILIVARNL